MSFSIKITRTFAEGGSDPQAYQKEFTEGSLVKVSEQIPDGSTDFVVIVAIDVSNLKALFVGSNKDLMIEINNPGGSSAAPDDTWALKANQPIDWAEDDVEDCPLAVDVTQIYVTNNSGAAADLEIRALVNPTP